MAPRPTSPPSECAICGAEIPRHARACPQCGADERTGWAEQDRYDGLDLPDDDDASGESQDINRRHQRTSGMTNNGPRGALGWLWWAVALGLLVILVLGWVFGIAL